MENREAEKESERNEEANESLWTKESFNLAEETERYEKGWEGMFELNKNRILARFNAYKITLNTLMTLLFENLQVEPLKSFI